VNRDINLQFYSDILFRVFVSRACIIFNLWCIYQRWFLWRFAICLEVFWI